MLKSGVPDLSQRST